MSRLIISLKEHRKIIFTLFQNDIIILNIHKILQINYNFILTLRTLKNRLRI